MNGCVLDNARDQKLYSLIQNESYSGRKFSVDRSLEQPARAVYLPGYY